jgi:hypothetical protein
LPGLNEAAKRQLKALKQYEKNSHSAILMWLCATASPRYRERTCGNNLKEGLLVPNEKRMESRNLLTPKNWKWYWENDRNFVYAAVAVLLLGPIGVVAMAVLLGRRWLKSR